MKNMKVRFAVGSMLALAVLAMAGCQWAKWREDLKGPEVSAPSGVEGGGQWVRVGVGRWTAPDGTEHVEPVYVRRDDGDKGPVGARGPAGARGKTEPDVAVEPDGPATGGPGYSAKGSTYRRDITVVSPPWGPTPADGLSKVKPFESRGDRLPSYSGRGFSVGETRGGAFAGGGLDTAMEAVRRGPVLLCVIGALALLAGIVVAVWAKRVVLGLSVSGCGGALIAAGVLFEVYPWVLLVALAALVGLGIWWLLDARAKPIVNAALDQAKTALSAVVRGVEAAPDDAQSAVKDSIASAATASGNYAAVKDTISKAKQEAGVG